MTQNTLPPVYSGSGLSLFAVANPRSPDARRTRDPVGTNSYGVQLLVAPIDRSGELNSDDTPWRHIGVSLFNGNRSVDDAEVRIVCEPLSATAANDPIEIPIQAMEVGSEKTGLTHFGSTVELQPGTYHIAVVVDEKARADFTIDV